MSFSVSERRRREKNRYFKVGQWVFPFLSAPQARKIWGIATQNNEFFRFWARRRREKIGYFKAEQWVFPFLSPPQARKFWGSISEILAKIWPKTEKVRNPPLGFRSKISKGGGVSHFYLSWYIIKTMFFMLARRMRGNLGVVRHIYGISFQFPSDFGTTIFSSEWENFRKRKDFDFFSFETKKHWLESQVYHRHNHR